MGAFGTPGKGVVMRKLYWLVHDLTVGYPFLRHNLGLTRMDIIKCNLKGECY